MVTKQQHSLKSRPETQDPQPSTLKPRTLRITPHDPGTWDSEIKDLGPGTQDSGTLELGHWDMGPTPRTLEMGPWDHETSN